MADTTRTVNYVLLAKDAGSATIRKFKGQLSGLSKLKGPVVGGLKGIGSAIKNVGKIALVAGAVAIAALGAALLKAGKDAAAEEKGIARLDAAIKANVKNTKGLTAAIDAQIKKAEGLAFGDDEVRDSLSRLLPITKDYEKALLLQNTAMDLARLKGISLEQASTIVGKVFAGNTGVLARYGIQVAKGATATEALAAIQKRAAGQAEAYGATATGAWESFQVALGNLIEDVGTELLPVFIDVARFLRTDVLPAVADVIDKVKAWVTQNKPLIDQVAGFVSGALTTLANFVTGTVIPAFAGGKGSKGIIPTVIDFGRELFEYVVPKVRAFIDNLVKPGGVVDSIRKVVDPILERLIPAFGKIVGALFDEPGGLVPALGRLAGELWGDGNGPLAFAVKSAGVLLEGFLGLVDRIAGAISGAVEGVTTFLRILRGDISLTRGVLVGFIRNIADLLSILPGQGLIADALRNLLKEIEYTPQPQRVPSATTSPTPTGSTGGGLVGIGGGGGAQEHLLLADGGIATKPTRAVVAEAGSAEAIIPLDSPTGRRMLGDGRRAGVTVNITYAPVYDSPSARQSFVDAFEPELLRVLRRAGVA